MDQFLQALMQWLSLPQHGLATVFVVAFVSATLLPMGSEPAVYGLVVLRPDLFWPAICIATVGNTFGGCLSWWMGLGAHHAVDKVRQTRTQTRAQSWLARFGPKACFFAFLPVIGDPLCAVAGWLKLPFWPCTRWMAAGKFLRYTLTTALLLWAVPDSWIAKVLHLGG